MLVIVQNTYFLEDFPLNSLYWVFSPKRKRFTRDTDMYKLAFFATAELHGFVLSRYLNGVMKNAAAPVLLELANEVIIFTFFFNLPG